MRRASMMACAPEHDAKGSFLLQHLSGDGTAWLELSGELVTKDLQAGDTLRVHPGHVGAFQASVSFQITTVPGIKNKIFGGDGIFIAALTGPGRVWLQTPPISKLAHARRILASHGTRRERCRRGNRRRDRGLHPAPAIAGATSLGAAALSARGQRGSEP